MKTAIYSTHAFETDYLHAYTGQHELLLLENELTLDSASLCAGCEAVSLFTSDDASAPVLEKLLALGIKNISLRSVGYDHVDLFRATALGIRVAHVPAYSPYAVAEHAVALLMALNRKLVDAQKLMAVHDYRLDSLVGIDLHGKTVGIVGLGKIGQAFVRIMNGFGCRILVYDPSPDPEIARALNAELVSFGEVCSLSDVISVHCPLNKKTHHLFDRHAFCLMKPNVILINTARGAIINTEDLLKFLDRGELGAVGLDVYEFEKGIFFHDHRQKRPTDPLLNRLIQCPNVLITGHQAFLTREALREIARVTFYNLDCFENNIFCENELFQNKESR